MFLEKLKDFELYDLIEHLVIFERTGDSENKVLNGYANMLYIEKDKKERLLCLLHDVNKEAAVRWRRLQLK